MLRGPLGESKAPEFSVDQQWSVESPDEAMDGLLQGGKGFSNNWSGPGLASHVWLVLTQVPSKTVAPTCHNERERAGL